MIAMIPEESSQREVFDPLPRLSGLRVMIDEVDPSVQGNHG